MGRRKLPAEFYLQDTIDVARQLIGARLVRVVPGGQRLSGTIVETEAYLGAEDPACHSFGYRHTPRTSVMFRHGGIAYVYFIYGMYNCFNVVTRKEGEPEAVLVRAVMPAEGLATMHPPSAGGKTEHIANGPGKLCRALRIDRSLNTAPLLGDEIFIEEDLHFNDDELMDGPRIGIGHANDAIFWPLRFALRGHPAVSPAKFPSI